MPDIIKLLPDHVANQIAAGEVIQRPASVVKELLENTVDAGSTEIKLIIKDGGRTLVQVIDNGKGMSETDARMAWERHATSKIASADDLFRLNTMGFRGEALASIASVAHVELKTRLHSEEIGTCIQIEGSSVLSQEPVHVTAGTSVMVKNLFYNVPARRNFLKSNPVETKYIIDEFVRVALSNPDKAFLFFNNDQEVFNLKPGSMKERILGIFSDKKSQQLLPAEETTSVVKITGFVGTPDAARKNRGEQFFFVNGRFFRDPYLNHAVVAAYDELIPKDCFPLYILHLEVNPQSIDVNVHPQKTEIKFEEEKIIYQILRSVVKKSLGGYMSVPEMDFNPDILKKSDTNFPNEPKIDTHSGFNPFGNPPQKSGDKNWKKLFDPYAGESFSERFEKEEQKQSLDLDGDKKSISQSQNIATTGHVAEQETKTLTQLYKSFILVQGKNGVFLLDQQAAHERILFERYLYTFENQRLPSQEKLFPKLIELNPGDFELLNELLPDLTALGFDISVFGKNTVIVNGLPADVKTRDEQELIEGMLGYYKANMNELRLEKRENLARSMARKACIKRNTELGTQEMTNLAEQLFVCQNPNYDTNGKPIFVKLGPDDLERILWKR